LPARRGERKSKRRIRSRKRIRSRSKSKIKIRSRSRIRSKKGEEGMALDRRRGIRPDSARNHELALLGVFLCRLSAVKEDGERLRWWSCWW
jgi:hypothetical protein